MKKNRKTPTLYDTLVVKGYSHNHAMQYLACKDHYMKDRCKTTHSITSKFDGGVTKVIRVD